MTDREKFEIVSLAEVLRRTRFTEPTQTEQEPVEETVSSQADVKTPTPQRQNVDSPAIKAKVLVVDDERIIADSLAVILHGKGYDARALYDGESALEACERGVPDCIISDVVMPGINGFELAVTVRQRFPQCRVLLFSGQAATTDMLERAGGPGMEFELMAKPVHPTDLLARLETRRPIPPQMRQAAAASCD